MILLANVNILTISRFNIQGKDVGKVNFFQGVQMASSWLHPYMTFSLCLFSVSLPVLKTRVLWDNSSALWTYFNLISSLRALFLYTVVSGNWWRGRKDTILPMHTHLFANSTCNEFPFSFPMDQSLLPFLIVWAFKLSHFHAGQTPPGKPFCPQDKNPLCLERFLALGNNKTLQILVKCYVLHLDFHKFNQLRV